jgi:transaldolase
MPAETVAPLQRLAELGQSVWIDYLSRELLERGELARLVREDAIVGVTSNPTIFAQAISHGEAYDAELRKLRVSSAWCYRVPSVLQIDTELAAFDDRRSAPADRVGRERQRERHPVRLAQRFAVA